MIFSKISNIRPFSLALVSLLKSGFTPTATQFNQFLFFLSKSKRFKLIIHLVKSNQFKGDSKTRRIFIEALVKEDKYDEAVQCLKEKNTQMEKRLFDSLIQPLCKRNPEKALSILQDCSIFESGLYLDFPWKTDYCFMGVLVILVSRIGVKDVMIACV